MEETLRLNLNSQDAPEAPDPAEYVGFGPRFGARVIDTLAHWAIGYIAGLAGGILFVIAGHVRGESPQAYLQTVRNHYLLPFALSFLGMTFYVSLCESLHGSTLGKQLLGFVVLRESKRPCALWAAMGRELAIMLDGILFGLVGAYAMSGNRREQRYGDQWCRTIVIRRRSAPSDALRSDLRFFGILFLAVAMDGLCLLLPYALAVAG